MLMTTKLPLLNQPFLSNLILTIVETCFEGMVSSLRKVSYHGVGDGRYRGRMMAPDLKNS